MYNESKVRLHVDLFIKYVSNNNQFYIDISNHDFFATMSHY